MQWDPAITVQINTNVMNGLVVFFYEDQYWKRLVAMMVSTCSLSPQNMLLVSKSIDTCLPNERKFNGNEMFQDVYGPRQSLEECGYLIFVVAETKDQNVRSFQGLLSSKLMIGL